MKKTKVENISNMRLELFLKQNKEDIRVILAPGEKSWCDYGTTTKSMILYERKKLIKSDLPIESLMAEELVATINTDELLDKTQNIKSSESGILETVTDSKVIAENAIEALTPLEKAQKETEEYKKESERTYKGKKRGRKKKRGPKPGSKKKKNGDNPPTDI